MVCTLTPLISYYYASKDSTAFIFYMALWSGSMFAGQIAAMLAVPQLIKKYNKKSIYNSISLFGAIPFITLFVLYLSAPTRMAEPLFLLIFMILLVACGASNGGTAVLQSIMVADAVDYEEYTNGTRPDGLFFSGVTFITKLGAGISVIISGIFYALTGFSGANVAEVNAFITAGGVPRFEDRYSNYMMVLFFLVSIPPAIGSILAVIPTWKYALHSQEYDKIVSVLNQRRATVETVEKDTVQ
jgi:Na+/melibiose symporter-like transporter